MNVLELGGCAPQPLAYYLKALGILRLVAEQKDPEVRGWWQDERFFIASDLSRDEVLSFFASAYRPSPLFNPWGARSGFYGGASERKARETLQSLSDPAAVRLESVRSAAVEISRVVSPKKPEHDDEETALLSGLRNRIRGAFVDWLDTAVVEIGDSTVKPSLFGTGGNEGSGSYTSAYMQALAECVLTERWTHALPWSLFGGTPRPASVWGQSSGQFAPGTDTNPWDLVLAFEGALLVRSSVTCRSMNSNERWLSSPFFVAPRSGGYGTAADIDEYALNKGKRLPGRGEQWFPLWEQPTRLEELRSLFMEGKASVKRGRARDAWSMARAVTSCGTSRGIREFVRYGYLQRNNLATHFAVPLGRFRVPDTVQPKLGLLDDLDGWLPRLRREARAKNAPARLQHAEKRLADALFAVVQHAAEPAHWQAVLMSMSHVEGVLASGSGFGAGPIPPLQPGWVSAGDDGSPELRLGVALGLATAETVRSTPDPVRRHAIPLLEKNRYRFNTASEGTRQRLISGPEVVMSGRDPLADCLALVGRRLVEASQHGQRHLPLAPAPKSGARTADLALLISGGVDLRRTLKLARAFMAIHGQKWSLQPCPPTLPRCDLWPDDAWIVVRLALLPWPLDNESDIAADPAVFRRLAAGDAGRAVTLARQRLEAKGLRVPFAAAAADVATARRWAAALAFPIERRTARRLAVRLAPTNQKEIVHV